MVKVGTYLTSYEGEYYRSKYIVACVDDYNDTALIVCIDREQAHLVIRCDKIKYRCFEIDDTSVASLWDWEDYFIQDLQLRRQIKYEKYTKRKM